MRLDKRIRQKSGLIAQKVCQNRSAENTRLSASLDARAISAGLGSGARHPVWIHARTKELRRAVTDNGSDGWQWPGCRGTQGGRGKRPSANWLPEQNQHKKISQRVSLIRFSTRGQRGQQLHSTFGTVLRCRRRSPSQAASTTSGIRIPMAISGLPSHPAAFVALPK